MAKVQEVKEIPTVKVLDVAQISDKRSFPPRLLIMFLGTVFSVAVAAAWISGKATWDKTDSSDARKLFAQEVFQTAKASLPWASKNGSRPHLTVGQVSVPLAPGEDAETSLHLRSK